MSRSFLVTVGVLFISLFLCFAPDVAFAECGCGYDVPCDGFCVAGMCSKCGKIKEGGICGLGSSNRIRKCESGTHCSSPLGEGTCVTKSGANQYCLTDSQCKSGLVCEFTQSRCRHDPPILGEACNTNLLFPISKCKSGEGLWCGVPKDAPLDSTTRCLKAGTEGDSCGMLWDPPCNEDAGYFCASIAEPDGKLTCKKKRTLGEPCWSDNGCRDPLQCRYCNLSDCDEVKACFPKEGHEVWPPEVCMALHRPKHHESAINKDITQTIGGGFSVNFAVATGSNEIGVAYGNDGRYGCYLTTCIGFGIGFGVSDFIATGQFWDYPLVGGTSQVFSLTVGPDIFNVGFADVLNMNYENIGLVESMNIGVGVSPPLSGEYVECDTILDTVAKLEDINDASSLVIVENEPPVAVCAEGLSMCVDSSCQALVDIDGGSYDPDEESLSYLQEPPGPFAPGMHGIDLTVTDPDGASDSCFAFADVEDCTAPAVTCPPPLRAECKSPLGAQVGFSASAEDNCAGALATQCEPGLGSWFALGVNALGCYADDDAGNRGQCRGSVTIVDTTPPALSCHSPGQVLATDFPLTIQASAVDVCDDQLPMPQVSDVRCVKPKANGKEVDVTSGCGVTVEGDRLTIHNGTGVGTIISWRLETSDASGNSSSADCLLEIGHPNGK